jgi:hypothetical protein
MLLLFPAGVVVVVLVVAIRSGLPSLDALAHTGIALLAFVLLGCIFFSTGWFGHALVPSLAFASLTAAIVATALAVAIIRLVIVPDLQTVRDDSSE